MTLTEVADEAIAGLELRINGLSGRICEITAQPSWTSEQVKEAVQKEIGVPMVEQRLFQNMEELAKESSMHMFLGPLPCSDAHSAALDLTLVRRHPEQARWLDTVAADWKALRSAPDWAKADREIVLAAVRQNGYTLQFASDELRADREVVSIAARQNGRALWFATGALCEDREVVLAAVGQSGRAYRFAGDRLRRDPGIVHAVIAQDRDALKFLEADLHKDVDIVTAAVRAHGQALQHASSEMRGNKAVVLAAVRDDGLALRFASKALRSDSEVVEAAVRQNRGAGQFADLAVLALLDLRQASRQEEGCTDEGCIDEASLMGLEQLGPRWPGCPVCEQIATGSARAATRGLGGHTYGRGCQRRRRK